MKGQVALVLEQGVDFAVVVVKPSVLKGSAAKKDELVRTLSFEFGAPAVLMARKACGVPTYYGREDLVAFLAGSVPEQLPLREFRLRAA